jgi:hypothetical protein
MNLRTMGDMKKGTSTLTQNPTRINPKASILSLTPVDKKVAWLSSTPMSKVSWKKPKKTLSNSCLIIEPLMNSKSNKNPKTEMYAKSPSIKTVSALKTESFKTTTIQITRSSWTNSTKGIFQFYLVSFPSN